jgi:hypothetical protein
MRLPWTRRCALWTSARAALDRMAWPQIRSRDAVQLCRDIGLAVACGSTGPGVDAALSSHFKAKRRIHTPFLKNLLAD